MGTCTVFQLPITAVQLYLSSYSSTLLLIVSNTLLFIDTLLLYCILRRCAVFRFDCGGMQNMVGPPIEIPLVLPLFSYVLVANTTEL